VLRRYDSLERDGRLDLREFLVLVRDLYNFQQLAARAERLFHQCDVDRSGDISLSELRQALLLLGLDTNAAQVSAILRKYDRDGNNRIDKLEFLALVKDLHVFRAGTLPPPTDAISRTFALYDRDLSGAMDVVELRDALSHLGMDVSTEDARRVLQRFDGDRSGQLDLAEFRTLVETLERYQGVAEPKPKATGGVEDDIRQQWLRADEDGSGTIDSHELHRALQRLGLPTTYEQTLEVLRKYDTEGRRELKYGEFRQLVLELRAFHRGADEVEAQFHAADTDQSGAIEVDELHGALARLGMPTDRGQTMQIFRRYDDDGAGSIELPEFRKLVAELRAFQSSKAPADDIEAEWRKADADGNGKLDLDELMASVTRLGLTTSRAQCQLLMDKYDEDRSGYIEYDEYRKIVIDIRAFQGGAKP